MRLFVAVTTHNPIGGLRMELLEQTVESIDRAFPSAVKLLFDNDSDDGSYQALQLLTQPGGWQLCCYHPYDGNHTPGRGRNQIMWQIGAEAQNHELVVFSDDDMLWRPGAEMTLRKLWLGAPERLLIACGLLEPIYRWNTPRQTIDCGGVNVLVRDSAPGAAWTFRRGAWGRIGPVKHDFGYDHDTCKRLVSRGDWVGQLDLAEHIGWGSSTHGNEAVLWSKPLDRDKWGV